MLVPWLGNVLYLFDLNPLPGLDLSVFAFAFSGIALSWALLRKKILDLVPIARTTIVEKLQSAVIVLDGRGQIVDLNPAAEALFELPSQGLLGRPLAALEGIWPELVGSIPEAAAGHAHRQVGWRREGAQFWYDLHASTLHDDRGQIIGQIILLLDITQQEGTQQRLRQAEDRYRDLVEHSHDLICTHDLEGVILSANPIALESLGYRPEDVIGQNIQNVLFPKDRARFGDYLEIIQKQGEARGLMKVRTRQGQAMIWEYHNTLRTEGVAQPLVRGLARDITAEYKAKKILERHLEELSTVHAVSLAGLDATDEDALIEYATGIIGGALFPDNFGLLMLDDRRENLVFHPSYRGVPPKTLQLSIPVQEGITGDVATSGQPRCIADVTTIPEYIVSSQGMHSEICVPLKVSGEVIGVINAESEQVGAFNAEDEQLMITFASQLAMAITKLRLLEAERQQAALLARANALIGGLASVAARMDTSRDPGQLLAVLSEQLTDLGFYCLVALNEPETQRMAFRYTSLPGRAVRLFEIAGGTKMTSFRFAPQQMAVLDQPIETSRLMSLEEGIQTMAQGLPSGPTGERGRCMNRARTA